VLSLEGPKKTKEMRLLQQSAVKREFSRWSAVGVERQLELEIGVLHTRTELRQRERTHLYK
jgi:hypothetical protein